MSNFKIGDKVKFKSLVATNAIVDLDVDDLDGLDNMEDILRVGRESNSFMVGDYDRGAVFKVTDFFDVGGKACVDITRTDRSPQHRIPCWFVAVDDLELVEEA